MKKLLWAALAVFSFCGPAFGSSFNINATYNTVVDLDGKVYMYQAGVYYDKYGNQFSSPPYSQNGYFPVSWYPVNPFSIYSSLSVSGTTVLSGDVSIAGNTNLGGSLVTSGPSTAGSYNTPGSVVAGGFTTSGIVSAGSLSVSGSDTAGSYATTGTSSAASFISTGASSSSRYTVGAATITAPIGSYAMSRISPDNVAPSSQGGKLELVCGTNAGTAKLIIYAGTSAAPFTIIDNVGSGVTGC